MLVDDLAADGQAEAEATVFVAGLLGGEVGGGEALKIFAADAFARVRDAHAHPLAARLGGGEPLQFEAHGGAGGRCVNRVGEDVAEAALHEHRVHLDDGGWILRQLSAHLAALEFRAGEVHYLVDELVQEGRGYLDGVVLREKECVLHVGLDGADVAQTGGEEFVRAVGVAVDLRARQLEVGGDGREQVVQVMRHTTRHAAQ